MEPIASGFQCPRCLAIVGSKRKLEDHINGTHDGLRPYTCSCGKTWKQNAQVNTCKKTHDGAEPEYKCTELGKDGNPCTFARFQRCKLLYHLANAHGIGEVRMYTCKAPGCTHSYRSGQNLAKHVKKNHPNQ